MVFLLPTDTCYGLAGALTREDYEAIYRLKGRDFSKQLAFLVEDYEDMKKYIEITDEQIQLLREYPHPWSFLGKRNPDFILPDYMDEGKYEMISLRVAKVCVPNEEGGMMNYEFPFFLTSANLSGNPESKTLAEAKAVFPGISGVDGGCCNRPPSDIFSIGEDGELRYVRRNYSSKKPFPTGFSNRINETE